MSGEYDYDFGPINDPSAYGDYNFGGGGMMNLNNQPLFPENPSLLTDSLPYNDVPDYQFPSTATGGGIMTTGGADAFDSVIASGGTYADALNAAMQAGGDNGSGGSGGNFLTNLGKMLGGSQSGAQNYSLGNGIGDLASILSLIKGTQSGPKVGPASMQGTLSATPWSIPRMETRGVAPARQYASGGLVALAKGGQADTVKAMLSEGEFVVPADVVSHLGDGNNESGALKLYSLMKNVRKQKGASNKLPPTAHNNAEQYLKKG